MNVKTYCAIWIAMVIVLCGVIWWSETPEWKRNAYWRKFIGYRPVMPVIPDWWIEREVADFMRKVARWEHDSRDNP